MVAKLFKIPPDCKLPTASKIPKKKNTVEASIFERAPGTVNELSLIHI